MESERNYQSPNAEVIDGELSHIICESGINSDETYFLDEYIWHL